MPQSDHLSENFGLGIGRVDSSDTVRVATDDGESPRGIWEENACMMAIPEGLMEFAFRGHFRDYK